jgi:adenosine deaminase
MSLKPTIEPLSEITIPPEIAAIPKADIHIHAEWSPRLDRVLAQREGRESYNWKAWAASVMQEMPGMPRLRHLSNTFPASLDDDSHPENFVARVEDMLEEAAADGAVLAEARFGKDLMDRPNCVALFREAERRVQLTYPQFHAALIPVLFLWWEPEQLDRAVQLCVEMARAGLIYGVDFLSRPYGEEADWSALYRVADKLVNTGLSITVHVAEVAPVNIEPVLRVPGLTRLGHATHAGYHPHLLEMVAGSGVTVECSLSCNVVLGAAPSYEGHPIRRFVEAGVPVALCTDDPVQICTTIGREYTIAHQLGFSLDELRSMTRNAINAAFISPEKRSEILKELDSPIV